jgi:hypothetical protein
LCAFAHFFFAPANAAQKHAYPFGDIQPDGIARGWRDNSSWADVDVAYRAGQVFEELKAQRVTLTRIGAGRAQLQGPAISIRKGNIYTISLRMKSLAGSAPVEFMIRERGAPYKAFAVRRTLDAGPEWQTRVFFVEARSDAPEYVLFLAFPRVCDVLIERLDILEETPAGFASRAASTGDARDLALLNANPAFLFGRVGYATSAAIDRRTQYPLRTGDQYSLNPPPFSTRALPDGKTVGVLGLGDHSAQLLTTMADLVPGRSLTALARVRRVGEKNSGPVTLRIFSPAFPSPETNGSRVGADWTDLALAVRPPLEEGLQARAELVASGSGGEGGELEIAYLVLTHEPEKALAHIAANGGEGRGGEGPSPAFGAEPDRAMTFYEAGETPVITLHHAEGGADKAVREAREVLWKIVDVHGNPLRTGNWKLATPDGPRMHRVENLPVGWWQLRWEAPWARPRAGVINLAVVPPTGRIAREESPFGIHVEGCEYGLEKMRYMGIQWLRTNNPLWTKWTAVQPERDVWVYPDRQVDLFCKAGKSILFNLDRTPRWAARDPDNYRPGTDYMDSRADLPADWEAWREYVRRMVTRYKDRIRYWEIWNEPDIPFLRPPPGMTNAQAYAMLLENSAPLIRGIDPAAKIVISPAYYLKKRGNPEGYQEDFTPRLIETGAFRHVDVYSLHFYLNVRQRIFDQPRIYAEKLDTIKKALRDAGRSGPEIWNSEWGIINFTTSTHPVNLPSTNGITPDQAARELVIWSAGMLAGGVEKLFWYDGMDNHYLHFHVTRNLFDYNQPRPAAVAFAVLTRQLDGLRFAGEEPVPENNGRVLRFASADGKRAVRVAWAHDGKTFTVPANSSGHGTGYLGQPVLPGNGFFTITSAPVYLK